MTTWRQQAVEGGSSDQEKRNFKKYSRLMSTAIRKLGEHPCITQSQRGDTVAINELLCMKNAGAQLVMDFS